MTMNPRLAAFISAVGSPVVLFPVVASYLTVSEVGLAAAWPVILTISAIFAALSAFILVRKMRGQISNLDVSNQHQRARNVYIPSLLLVLFATLYFYWTEQPYVYRTLYVGLLLGICFAINTVKKISLHTVVATYLSGLMVSSSLLVGVAFFIFAALIAWSRVVLGRHTQQEVLLGWLVGSVFGLAQMWIF